MNEFQPWDVWWADVRFEDQPTETKVRPVVILSSGELFVVAIKVTSHVPRDQWGEYALIRWKEAGLPKPSTLRLQKRLRLQRADLRARIGALHPSDIFAIERLLSKPF